MYVCMYIYIYIYTHTHIYIYIYVCMYNIMDGWMEHMRNGVVVTFAQREPWSCTAYRIASLKIRAGRISCVGATFWLMFDCTVTVRPAAKSFLDSSILFAPLRSHRLLSLQTVLSTRSSGQRRVLGCLNRQDDKPTCCCQCSCLCLRMCLEVDRATRHAWTLLFMFPLCALWPCLQNSLSG